MKKIIICAIIGLVSGLIGSILFEASEGFLGLLLSDFSLGGIIVGILSGMLVSNSTTLSKKLLYSVLTGLIIFFVFGLLSGYILDDLIAGAVIGAIVGLGLHLLSSKLERT